MSVHKRGTKWHYAFCIRGVRYRGAIPEASTKFDAEKAETKIRQDVYEGRYGRPTGKKDFGKFVEEVYKPWAMENKRSFKSNDKYKLSIICESKCFKGKTFAQISPLLIEKYKKERRETLMENGRTRNPRPLTASWEYSPRSFHSRLSTASPIQIRAEIYRGCRKTISVYVTCWMRRSQSYSQFSMVAASIYDL